MNTSRAVLYRHEWPTWLVIVAVHGGWLGLLAAYRAHWIGLPLTTALLAVWVAWYMSLQHELIHGHPTRSAWLNGLFGLAPLAIWYPYWLYRESHLRHHTDSSLTLPDIDPESTYVSQARWAQAGPLERRLLTVRKTFLGRLLLGPPWGVITLLGAEIQRPGDGLRRLKWLGHGALCVALLSGVQALAGIPAWYYLLAVTWPALALASVRAFYEHRAQPNVPERTVINEGGGFTRLLFLNNNLHAVHHARPDIPWYALPAFYRAHRAAFLSDNGHFHVPGGYAQLLRQYALRPVDGPVHPEVLAGAQARADQPALEAAA